MKKRIEEIKALPNAIIEANPKIAYVKISRTLVIKADKANSPQTNGGLNNYILAMQERKWYN